MNDKDQEDSVAAGISNKVSSQLTLKIPATEAELKMMQDWADLLNDDSNSVEAKFRQIKKAVMDELGFTKDEDLQPLGLRYHLNRLAGHRYNDLEMFKEDIEGKDKDDLREQMYWLNMSVALNYVDMVLRGNNKGYIERMNLAEAQS